VVARECAKVRAGLRNPARFWLLMGSVWLATSPVSAASLQQTHAAEAGIQKVDQLIADKLVWWSLAALDQANKTGNYSVLRDLGTASFQTTNSAATLGSVFERLRSLHLDLANTLNLMPVYSTAPAMQGDVLRARGVFSMRPNPVGFDILFQRVGTEWKLLGLSVVPLVRVTEPPGR
jgi:hypothetical protein